MGHNDRNSNRNSKLQKINNSLNFKFVSYTIQVRRDDSFGEDLSRAGPQILCVIGVQMLHSGVQKIPQHIWRAIIHISVPDVSCYIFSVQRALK